MSFADRVHKRRADLNTCLVAGFDPDIDNLPGFLLEEAHKVSDSNDEAILYLLNRFHSIALQVLAELVIAIKPNLAFYEQYGLVGMSAFARLCQQARELGLLVIADGKRGDIANTSRAYSNAFLGRSKCFGQMRSAFDVDALTVNPFLGFESLEPFIKDCEEYEKGIFVLVRTSNPDAEVIQNLAQEGSSLSERIARWIDSQSHRLAGACGWSGLGAVVGATKPEVAATLRKLMPKSIFLIPGLGAQGADAAQALEGFAVDSKNQAVAGLINVSRSLLANFSAEIKSEEMLAGEIRARANQFNQTITQALIKRSGSVAC